MRNTDPRSQFAEKQESTPSVKEIIRKIVESKQHESERRLIKNLAAELNTSFLDCAAALAYYVKNTSAEAVRQADLPEINVESSLVQPRIRLVRYRLAIGHLQNATLDEIKKVLVEESGVDVNNIANVRIQDSYTLIDLPDEMPQEIFHHLKMVEINQHKLDIRRVKNRSRVRNNRKSRQIKKSRSQSGAGYEADNKSGANTSL
jgi:hypothetical protein